MNFPIFAVIVVSVSLNSFAQIFLRKAALGLGALTAQAAFGTAVGLLLNPWFILGMASYAVSILLWIFVLSKLEVSLAYPFLSIGYVIAAVVGFFYLGESVTPQRIFGIALICAGLVFIARS